MSETKVRKRRIYFHQWLARKLRETEQSTDSLAADIGVSGAVVRYWLQGNRQPNLTSAVKLAKKYGVPIAEIADCRDFHE